MYNSRIDSKQVIQDLKKIVEASMEANSYADIQRITGLSYKQIKTSLKKDSAIEAEVNRNLKKENKDVDKKENIKTFKDGEDLVIDSKEDKPNRVISEQQICSESTKAVIIDESLASVLDFKSIFFELCNKYKKIIFTNYTISSIKHQQFIDYKSKDFLEFEIKKAQDSKIILDIINKDSDTFEIVPIVFNENINNSTDWIIEFCKNRDDVILYTSNRFQVLLAKMYKIEYKYISMGTFFYDKYGKKCSLYCAVNLGNSLVLNENEFNKFNQKIQIITQYNSKDPKDRFVLHKGDNVYIVKLDMDEVVFFDYKIISTTRIDNCINVFSCRFNFVQADLDTNSNKVVHDRDYEYPKKEYKEFVISFLHKVVELKDKIAIENSKYQKLPIINPDMKRVILHDSILDSNKFCDLLIHMLNNDINIILTNEFINQLQKNIIEKKKILNVRFLTRLVVNKPEKFEIVVMDESFYKYCEKNKEEAFVCTRDFSIAQELREHEVQVVLMNAKEEKRINKINTLFNTKKVGKKLIIEEQLYKNSRKLVAIFNNGVRYPDNTDELHIGDDVFIATEYFDYNTFIHYRVISLSTTNNCEKIYCRTFRSIDELSNLNEPYFNFIQEFLNKVKYNKLPQNKPNTKVLKSNLYDGEKSVSDNDKLNEVEFQNELKPIKHESDSELNIMRYSGNKIIIPDYEFEDKKKAICIINSRGKFESGNVELKQGDNIYIATIKEEEINFTHYEVKWICVPNHKIQVVYTSTIQINEEVALLKNGYNKFVKKFKKKLEL